MPPNPQYEVEIIANPKGEVHVTYQIESDMFHETDGVNISIPGYMYDYYSLRGITWPLSRKVRDLDNELVSIEPVSGELDKNEIDITMAEDGHYEVAIPHTALGSDPPDQVFVHFMIPNMINKDIVFYKLIFPVTGPTKNLGRKYFDAENETKNIKIDDLSVVIRSHFAFNIFSYAVRAKKYDLRTGETINGLIPRTKQYISDISRFYQGSTGFVDKSLEGDVIKARWEGGLEQNEEVDFRIRGAHLPIFGKFNRALFWTVIWILLILVFVSPFLDVFMDFLFG